MSGARDDLGPPAPGDGPIELRVVGVGGGGCNAVDRIFQDFAGIGEVWALNTDAQHLLTVHAHHKMLLGRNLCRGRSANADPRVGELAAEEARLELAERLKGTRLLFCLAGLGGGTGSGATPVVAKIARELHITTVAFVTRPFTVEGQVRAGNAQHGLSRLRATADFVSVFPNDRLLQTHPGLSVRDALRKADEALFRPIRALHRAARRADTSLVRARLRGTVASSAASAVATRQRGYAAAAEMALNSARQGLQTPAQSAVVVAGSAGDLTEHDRAAMLSMAFEGMPDTGSVLWGYYVDPALAGTCEVSVFLGDPASPSARTPPNGRVTPL